MVSNVERLFLVSHLLTVLCCPTNMQAKIEIKIKKTVQQATSLACGTTDKKLLILELENNGHFKRLQKYL